MAGQRRKGGLYEHRPRCTEPGQRHQCGFVFRRTLFGMSHIEAVNTKNVDGDCERASDKGRRTPWVPKVSSGLARSARQVA
jgi:hypothetical protein